MRLVVLLGSGASIGAGMPRVATITERVLSGKNIVRHTNELYHTVDEVQPHHTTAPVEAAVEFLHELKAICDGYFKVGEPLRETNYEDLAYLVRQIDDAIYRGGVAEYENPGLAPLIERHGGVYSGRSLGQLKGLTHETAHYIDDVAHCLLASPLGDLDYLTPISDAFGDSTVDQLDLFTLNHDRVVPTWLAKKSLDYSDGFEREYGTLRLWKDTYAVADRRVFNLHGSIEWYRYGVTIDGWSGQMTARVTDGKPAPARDPKGELIYPASFRPRLLAGTFNKILSYPSDIFADQHFRFHEALQHADRVLVIGYSFRDKAINGRLIAWAQRPGERRMVVVHRDPDGVAEGARGAIQNHWQTWKDGGLLAFVSRHLGDDTRWPEMRSQLSV